jgi:5-methylcytosine-specific restriction endonuclease McrA
VLRRDAYVCRVSSACPTPATVADHVVEVYPGMPDALFYDPTNLRASCSRHNTARGIAARLERETRSDRPTSVVTRDYTRR